MFQYRFTPKFYTGIAFIILSLVSGNVAKVFFIVYFAQPALRWTWLLVYIASWVILFIGIWWAGREAYEEVQRYFSYRYYHEKVRDNTRKAWERTKMVRQKMKDSLQRKNAEREEDGKET